ncbi:MAG: hypothetical protein DLM58_13685 [Pseudonocardiales bacterium]|nr:MAG: hypothetical protein DLM58_13685 [Pseudonocardiales bacterium]
MNEPSHRNEHSTRTAQTTPAASNSSAARIAYLDGIRAVAITGVLIEHWWVNRFPGGTGGYLGVDLFFVLSGYIITSMLWRSRDRDAPVRASWARFLYRRFRRLYPALLGLLVGSIVLYAVVPHTTLSTRQVSGHALISAFQVYPLWFGAPRAPFLQTWSLAIEWYFYLLWPLVLFYLKRRGTAARSMARGTVAAAIVIYLGSLALPGDWFYGSPPARFAELLAGSALGLYLIAREPQGPPDIGARPRAVLGLVALCALALYFMAGPNAFGPYFRFVGVPLAVATTGFLILAGVSNGGQRDPAIRLLSMRWVALLGLMSYSLYLWHLAITGMFRKDALGLSEPVMALFELGATAALTVASYLLLERPFTKPRSDALQPGRPSPPLPRR